MKIKSRLVLGFGFLFVNVIILALIGSMQIRTLSEDTKNILVANYNTLDYTRQMMMALDAMNSDRNALNAFRINLIKQQNNITETGEGVATQRLTQHFEKLIPDNNSLELHREIRKDLYEIMNLNMEAIQRKSKIAEETADKSNRWIVIAGSICFLLSFTLLVNLPGSISSPIRELTNSIQLIAAKQYKERVHFNSKSEFGELAMAFNTMAAKLEEYDNSNLAKLLIEKKRIETLINKLHHPIIVLDDKRNVVLGNHEALNILGLKSEQVIGKSANEISVTNDLMRSLLRSISNTDPLNGQQNPLKIFANNRESYFEMDTIPLIITPTGETKSKEIGHVIILQNITPFKELDSAKTNFIATISHELKTPISSIRLSLQLLRDQRIGFANDEQQKLMHSIHDDTDRLLSITSELLNLSQVETGNIQLSIQQTDPKQIIQYALEAVKVQAEQKHVFLKLYADDQLTLVKADSEKTAWVLINLLNNAIRYSPENSEIIIGLKQEDKKVLFTIKDFGQGIDPKYADRIFDRYFQVPGSSKSGTGLGLAISKEFIQAQEGEIGMESQLGDGCLFYFRLKTAAI